MDEETAEQTVDFILSTPTNSLTIEFQGGDCLANYQTTEHIIDYAKKRAESLGKNVNFRLVTNMTLMNDEIMDSLKEREIRGIATSLDGPKDVHNRNRPYLGGGNTYEDVEYWIKKFSNEFGDGFNLNALSTVTKHSLGRGEEIVDRYIELGFNNVWLRPLNNIGFADDQWEEIGYSPEEFVEFWKNTLDYIIERNMDGEDIQESMAVIFAKKIFEQKDPQMVDIMSPCGAGIGQLLYGYDGSIYTCDEGKIDSDFRLGRVEQGYREVMDSDLIRKMMAVSSKEGYVCSNCEWNPFCGVCPIYTKNQQESIVSKLPMDGRANMYREVIKDMFRRIIFESGEREIMKNWTENNKPMV